MIYKARFSWKLEQENKINLNYNRFRVFLRLQTKTLLRFTTAVNLILIFGFNNSLI